MFYNENIYHLLCSSKNPVFRKIFVPEIWAKIFSGNQIPDFLINHISRTNQWNSLIFLHVDTNSHKLKVDEKIFEWPWSKMGVASLVMGLKWLYLKNECCCCKLRKAKTFFNDFWVGVVKNRWGHSVHETLKSAVS